MRQHCCTGRSEARGEGVIRAFCWSDTYGTRRNADIRNRTNGPGGRARAVSIYLPIALMTSHAGCYCMCDLQQLATSLISESDVAIFVLARVVSTYPHRNEAMCDAGALAVSKDTGPFAGFGHVVSPPHARGWDLGRISQEHGTLIHRPGEEDVGDLKIGDRVRIIPQHACLTCASYSWIYVVEDGGEEVVDVWVPWKGW